MGKRLLIFGAVSDKAYEGMIGQIADSGLFADIAVVNMDNGRAMSADALSDIFKTHGVSEVSVWQDVADAYEVYIKQRSEEDRIYIAGSLYLVGEFKGYLRMRGCHD